MQEDRVVALLPRRQFASHLDATHGIDKSHFHVSVVVNFNLFSTLHGPDIPFNCRQMRLSRRAGCFSKCPAEILSFVWDLHVCMNWLWGCAKRVSDER